MLHQGPYWEDEVVAVEFQGQDLEQVGTLHLYQVLSPDAVNGPEMQMLLLPEIKKKHI